MARPIRVEYPDAVYHVTARGNQGKAIYREDHDRERFLSSLVEREVDRRVAIWLRVHAGPERMTKVAAQYGYKDGSGVHQVVKRLGGKGEERSSTLSPPDCACRRCVKQELTPPSHPRTPYRTHPGKGRIVGTAEMQRQVRRPMGPYQDSVRGVQYVVRRSQALG